MKRKRKRDLRNKSSGLVTEDLTRNKEKVKKKEEEREREKVRKRSFETHTLLMLQPRETL